MNVQIRLSIMMFLQYAVWGAWYVTVGNYMGSIGMSDVIHWAYTVSPIAAIVSPFFLGMVADRYFATEKVLGVLHIVGGLAMFIAPFVAEGVNAYSKL
ncbi:MAG: MFS transporter, partial [Bacteroidota bacterium]